MAESQHTAGIRVTGDGSSAVEATKKVTDEQKKLGEQLGKTSDQAKRNNEESRRFVEGLREQAATLGKSRAEVERYRASQLEMTEAQRKSANESIRQIKAYEDKQKALAMVSRAAAIAGAAIVALGVATAVAARSAINEADELNKLSQSLAISTETLSAYRYQMQLSGVANEEFRMGMRTLAQRVAEAQAGVGEGAEAFRVLGPAVEQAAKRGAPLAALMPLIADGFARFADGPNKTAAGLLLFGRAGERLIPMLNAGSRGIDEMRREAERLGVVISGDFARKAEQFNDNLSRITISATSLKYELAGGLLDAVDDVAAAMARGAVEGGKLKMVWEGLAALAPKVVPQFLVETYEFGQRLAGYDARALRAGRADQAAFEAGLAGTPDFSLAQMSTPRSDPAKEAARRAAEQKQKEELLKIRETLAKMDERGLDWAEQALSVEEDYAKVEAARLKFATEERRRQVELDTLMNRYRTDGLDWAEQALSVEEDHEKVTQLRLEHEAKLAKTAQEASKAMAEQAKEAQRAWERTADNIERSLVDAIMRGGKSGLDYLRDAMRTAILTPIIQPLVRPVAGAMASVVQGVSAGLFGGSPGYAGGMFGGGMGGAGGLGGILNMGGIAGMGGGQLFADFGNFFGSIGATTEMGGTFGMMDALGGFAAANPWATAAIIGGGLLLGSDLFGGDHGPKASEVNLFRDAAGQFRIGDNNLPGSQANQPFLRSFDAALNDPRQFDQATLAQFAGRSIGGAPGESAESMVQKLMQLIEPAHQVAEQQLATQQALLRQQEQSHQALQAMANNLEERLRIPQLERYRDALAISEHRAPLDRLGAARSIYDETYTRALGGDLAAVGEFQQAAQALLGIGRETYASGMQFQDIYSEVTSELGELLDKQQAAQIEIMKDLPATVMQAGQDTVDELKRQTAALVQSLQDIKDELRRLPAHLQIG